MTKLARNLGGQIATVLRGDIVAGRMAEGEHLQEAGLAARFGTSRGPVRDALLELSKEGVVVSQSRGVTVAGSAPDSIQKLVLPIRRTIECHALELCFDSLSEQDFQIWDDIVARMRRACIAEDYAVIVEQDVALHRSFLERSGQPDLLAIWTTIVGRMRRYFIESSQRYDDPIEHHAQHADLLAVLRQGNKQAAVTALEMHIK